MKSIEGPEDSNYGARVLAACRTHGLSIRDWNDITIRAMEKASRLEFLELFKKHSTLVSYPLIETIRTASPEVLVQRLAREKAAREQFEHTVPLMFMGFMS